MKRFAFRLQKVLDLRLHEEKEIELQLAVKEGECRTLENLILSCHLRKKAAFDNRFQGGIQVDQLIAFEFFARKMDKDIENNEKILAQKMLERDEIQKAFMEAMKKRKVLDNIRDRRFVQWKKEMTREEVKSMDDMNTQSYIRKLQAQEVIHG